MVVGDSFGAFTGVLTLGEKTGDLGVTPASTFDIDRQPAIQKVFSLAST